MGKCWYFDNDGTPALYGDSNNRSSVQSTIDEAYRTGSGNPVITMNFKRLNDSRLQSYELDILTFKQKNMSSGYERRFSNKKF